MWQRVTAGQCSEEGEAARRLPAAFLPGTTGQLYKQFAITIAISVAISGLNCTTASAIA